ncbi:hypothetical protein [Streptomyces sp. NPDC059909]
MAAELVEQTDTAPAVTEGDELLSSSVTHTRGLSGSAISSASSAGIQ